MHNEPSIWQSSTGRLPILITCCALLAVGVGWFVARQQVGLAATQSVEASLNAVLDTTHAGVVAWNDSHMATATYFASSPLVLEATTALLEAQTPVLQDAPQQHALRKQLVDVLSVAGYAGYFVVAPNGINLASSRDENIGVQSILTHQDRFWAACLNGTVQLSHPQTSDVALDHDQAHLPDTMFVGAPIRDDSGRVIAVFALRIAPGRHFSTILQRGRLGETGESYALNREGIFISHSRFEPEMRSLGLLQPLPARSVGLRISDPGRDLRNGVSPPPTDGNALPLTRMAQHITAGESGQDLFGYADYRGVPVVGAWRWSPELSMGFATEQDVDEAYRGRQRGYVALDLFAALCTVLTVLGLTVTLRGHRRIELMNQSLSAKVKERTATIEMAEAEGQAMVHQLNEWFTLSLDMICIAGSDTYFKQVNPAFTEILGWTVEELLARPFLDLIHPDDVDATLAEIATLNQGKRLLSFENRYRCKDGTLRRLSWKAAPHEGQFYCVARDVTDQHLQQVAMEADALALTTLNRRLRDSNTELDQFAYVASHDLKAPLRDIDNLTTWILEDALDALPTESQEYLLKVRDRVARMERLLDSLLEHSRVGLERNVAEELDVGELLKEVCGMVGCPPTFNLVMPTETTILKGPRVPLALVLRNLIANSIKHSQRPDGTVIVSIDDLGDNVAFNVADDGIGIAPEFHDRIWGMFQTLRPRDEVEGAGMGLALVRKIVRFHGGDVTLSSQVGAGATFRFTWPKHWQESNRTA